MAVWSLVVKNVFLFWVIKIYWKLYFFETLSVYYCPKRIYYSFEYKVILVNLVYCIQNKKELFMREEIVFSKQKVWWGKNIYICFKNKSIIVYKIRTLVIILLVTIL